MHSYELSDEAEKDFREIARYTDRTWGREQAERYRRQLEKRFRAIAAGDAHTHHFFRTDQICVFRAANGITSSFSMKMLLFP